LCQFENGGEDHREGRGGEMPNEKRFSGVDNKMSNTTSRADNRDERVKVFVGIKLVDADSTLDGDGNLESDRMNSLNH